MPWDSGSSLSHSLHGGWCSMTDRSRPPMLWIRPVLWFWLAFTLTVYAGFALADTIPATGPSTVPATASTETPVFVGMVVPDSVANSCLGAYGHANYSSAGSFFSCALGAINAAYGGGRTLSGTSHSGNQYFATFHHPGGWDITPDARADGSCPTSGYSLSSDGSTCTGGYSCPVGTLSGTDCTGVYTCPSGYTLSSTSCTAPDCPVWQSRVDGVCSCTDTATPSMAVNSVIPERYFVMSYSDWQNNKTCYPANDNESSSGPGCMLRIKGDMAFPDRNEGWGSAYGTTGESCTYNPTSKSKDKEDSPEAKCIEQGLSYGTVSGSVVCVPKGTTPTTLPTTTSTEVTKNGSGTTTGTTETTKSTTCTEGTCTTTTTTTTKDGSGATTGTTTTTTTSGGAGGTSGGSGGNGKGDGTGSGFTSACTAGAAKTTCDGDAVQCAIAIEQHRRNCEFYSPSDVMSTADAQSEMAKAAATEKDPKKWVPTKEVDAGDLLNLTERLNAGACLSDEVVDTPLGAFTVKLAWTCPYLEAIGYIVLFSSLMVAGRIFLGAI